MTHFWKIFLNISNDENLIMKCSRKIMHRKPDIGSLYAHLVELKKGRNGDGIIRSLAHCTEAISRRIVYKHSICFAFMGKVKSFLKSRVFAANLIIWLYRWIRYGSLKVKSMENVMRRLEEINRRQIELSYKTHLFMKRVDKEGICTSKEGMETSLKKKGKDKVSIIIPVYNKLEYTTMCLNALERHTPSGLDYEVIVVDDHSIDETERALPEMVSEGIKKRLNIFRNKHNLDFGRSINRGVKEASGNILVLLNNDVFVTEGWMEAFLSALDKENADIIGGKLLYPDGTIQHAGGVFYYEGRKKGFSPYHIYRGFPSNFPGVNKQRHFKWVTFACVMMERRLFEDLGGFSDIFKNSCEDVDFCLRAAKKGHSILYEPRSVAYHLECITRGYDNPQDLVNFKSLRQRYRMITEDDFLYYMEDGIPVEYGREYSNRWFTKRVKKIPFRIEALKEVLK